MFDPLLTLLPTAHDSDRPWLVCYGPHQRTELTGHVLAMWHAKTAALITAESPEPPLGSGRVHTVSAAASPAAPAAGTGGTASAVHVGTGAHWRGVAWACGAWLAGRQVVAGDGRAVEAAGLAPGTSVALDVEGLCPASQLQVLVPHQDLAVRWPGELPPLVVDGVADLMAYPDHFDPVPAVDEVCLTEVTTGLTMGLTTGPATASGAGARAEGRVVDGTGAGAAGTASGREVGLRTYPVADLTAGTVADPASGGGGLAQEGAAQHEAGQGRGGAVLVREHGLGPALRGVLAAWRAGMTAVLLTEDADDDVAAAAARQEGAVR